MTRQHPEYEDEKARLNATVAAIQAKIAHIKAKQLSGADEHSEAVLSWNFAGHREELEANQDKPYFVRIDFEEKDKPCEQIYIGKTNLDLDQHPVYSWYSEVAKLQYETKEAVQYKARSRVISGRLLLKRQFVIERAILEEFFDAVDRRAGGSGIVAVNAPQAHLLAQLHRRGEARLSDIVATIQKEQDEIIRAPREGVLVVNGVAGSGKTQVAFHRIAYLLSPGNKERFGLDAARTVVFVPNQLFLNHVRQLLPDLNIEGVTQTTFSAWAAKKLFPQRNVNIVDRAGDALNRPRVQAQTRQRYMMLASLKGSEQYAQLLDRLLERHEAHLSVQQDRYDFDNVAGQPVTLSLQREELEAAHQRARLSRLSFNQKRQLMKKGVVLGLTNQAWKKLGRLLSPHIRAFEAELNREVNELLDQVWPPVDARNDYYTWINDASLLKACADATFTDAEVDSLSSHVKPAKRRYDIQDLVAILYLQTRADGVARGETFDHVVVDEAQDLSVLQYHVLLLHNPNTSMTLVGDIAQGVHAYRGLPQWQDLNIVFGDDFKRLDVTQNYRSTEQIVVFTNEVLRLIRNGSHPPAKPFARSGSAVAITSCDSHTAMIKASADSVLALQEAGLHNIALILKDDGSCEDAALAFKALNLEATVLTAHGAPYDGGVAFLTPAVAKGLEFAAVLVLGADAKNYAITNELDGPRLYVALTRALHHLHVLYTGELSPFLTSAVAGASAADRVDIEKRREPQLSDVNPHAEPRGPSPFQTFTAGGANGLRDAQFETRDGSSGVGHLFRDNGRFGSFPLHDRYDDESDAE